MSKIQKRVYYAIIILFLIISLFMFLSNYKETKVWSAGAGETGFWYVETDLNFTWPLLFAAGMGLFLLIEKRRGMK